MPLEIDRRVNEGIVVGDDLVVTVHQLGEGVVDHAMLKLRRGREPEPDKMILKSGEPREIAPGVVCAVLVKNRWNFRLSIAAAAEVRVCRLEKLPTYLVREAGKAGAA